MKQIRVLICINLLMIVAVRGIGQRSDSALVSLHVINKHAEAYAVEVGGNAYSVPAGADTLLNWRLSKSNNFVDVFLRPENTPGSRHMLLYQMMFPVDSNDIFTVLSLDSVTLQCTAAEQLFQLYQQHALDPNLLPYCDSLIQANRQEEVSAAIILSQYCHREIPDSLILSAFNQLDIGPRLSPYGRKVSEYLKSRQAFQPGRYFNFGSLQDVQGKTHRFPWLTSDYTLVEFWYSDCLACKRSFVALDSIYRICNRDRFQVITISCDAPEVQANWKGYLQKLVWPWLNLLDASQLTARRYAISYFPTKVLLDRYLKILKIDPSTSELLAIIHSRMP